MRITTLREGAVASLSLEGSLDATWCGEFERAVESLLREGAREVEVRCAQVSFVSSAGMGSLLRMHKSVRAAGGGLRLTGVGPSLLQTIRLMKLDSLLLGPQPAVAKVAEMVSAPGLQARVQRLGGSGFRWSRSRQVPDGAHETLEAQEVLLGVGCLGHRSVEHAGELLGVGPVAVALPSMGAQADLLVDGTHGPALTLVDAARLRGRASEHLQFEATQGVVALEDLLRIASTRAGGAACVVVAGELEGAVGVSARRSPAASDFAVSLSSAQGARRSLRWIGTPSFRGDLMIAVAVVAPTAHAGACRDFLRPHGEGLLAHAHGVVTPFRPLPLEEPDPGVVVQAALEGAALRTVMHLVRDGRHRPAVQTAFRRGVLWVGALHDGGAA